MAEIMPVGLGLQRPTLWQRSWRISRIFLGALLGALIVFGIPLAIALVIISFF